MTDLHENISDHIIPIIKIVVFIILFCILCLIMNYLCMPNIMDIGVVKGFYAEEKKSIDVVYIGGSAAFVYYEPLMAYEEYGISSYVLGANTIQPESYRLLVSEVIKRQNPKLIILDARAFQYHDYDQPPTEVAYRNILTSLPLSVEKHNFIQKYAKNISDEADALTWYFSFIKFHSNKKDERYSFVDGIYMLFNKYYHPYKGFYFVPKIEKQTFVNYSTDEENAMSDETVEILMDFLDYCKEKNINVLFVVSPYIERKEHKENFNYIERVVKENGFEFVDANDYRKEMKLDYNTDFYNENHVNIFGADKYTKFICEYMKSNYDIRDISGNSEWDKLLIDWNKTKANIKKEIKDLMG